MRIESFLNQSPVFQARRIARKMEASINRILQQEDLTLSEALILAAIFFEKEGTIKPSQLAATLETTRANVSHNISSLEAKALLQREIDPADARAIQLIFLPQGRKRAIRVVGILDRIQRHLEEKTGAAKLGTTLAQMCSIEQLCSGLAKSFTRNGL